MAKKKLLNEEIVKIKKAIEEGKAVIGTKEVITSLRSNDLVEVFLSSNCPPEVEKDLLHMTSLNDIKTTKLTQGNDDLGVVCKKPFSISVLGIKQ